MSLNQSLVPVNLRLDRLYLDPNNPRFVGSSWVDTPIEEIDNGKVQERVRQRLVADYSVDKLRMSMEVNGYLPIDRIVVREFKPEKYVVLEGNRRICAAQMISAVGIQGDTVGTDVLDSLKNIPCLLYVGEDNDAAWIFQGLRHITGIAEWNAYNKARLLVTQMEEQDLSLSEAGKQFGLTAFGAGQWVRGYFAFQQARSESSYVQEVDDRSYPYFQELFSRSSAPVREWLEWNEDERKFRNLINLDEFVGWLYPRPDAQANQDENKDVRGDWEKRYLLRRDDIRTVASLMRDATHYFQQFRIDHDLEKASAMATVEIVQRKAQETADPVRAVFESIKICSKALDDIPFKILRTPDLYSELKEQLAILKNLIDPLERTGNVQA
jgi:hypothetical protein